VAAVKVQWSIRSLGDLEEIIKYIARDSPAAARNFALKIIEAVDVLEIFAMTGRTVPEYRDTNIREILYRNYRIVYQLTHGSVTIVTVFHGSRLFQESGGSGFND